MPHRLQDSFFRALFQSRVAGMVVADLKSETVIETNSQMLDILGRSRDEIVGVPFAWRDVTPREYHALDERALSQLAERGYSDPFEKEYLRPDGSRVPVRISCCLVEEHPDKLILFAEDITEHRKALKREREMQARLEIALSAAEQGVWDWDLVSGEMVYSDRAKQIYGLPVDQPVTYEQIRDATHPEDYPHTSAQSRRAIDPAVRDRSSYEYRIIRPDGGICWALAYGEAVFEGPPGAEKAVRYAGTIQDITERKRAERHQQILIAELNHRVKNMLAIVQALAYQTFKEDVPESVAETFAGRLSALAAAHDILTNGWWEAAEMREIAEAVLEPHLDGKRRIKLVGDGAALAPQMAVNVAMALHELATNATKYGALSRASGGVDLSWSVARHSAPRLRIEWREHGGPPVVEPAHEGFGTRMLKRLLANELDGAVTLAFNPGGVECVIDAPVGRLVEDRSEA
jgi:PAS domain S-box-containing protein